MKKLMTLVAVGLCAASALQAVDTMTWTGAENNLWTNKNNWAGGKKPTGQSHAIFDPGEGKTILIDMKGMGWGTTSDWPNLYEFRSGNTYFSTYIRYTGNGTATPGVFDIAEGATVVVSNEIFTANGKACMRKTGKGSLTCVGKFGNSAAIPQVFIDEGLFYFMSKDNATLGNLNRATIKSGGTFYTTGGSTTLGGGQMVIDIEKGGRFKASCGGTSYANKIDHFEGDGTVEGVGDYAIRLYMGTSCVRPFSGNFEAASGKSFNLTIDQTDNQFVVGGLNTLSTLSQLSAGTNLVFSPSTSAYNLKYRVLSQEGTYRAMDVNGMDVTTRTANRISVAANATLAGGDWYMDRYYGFYWGKDNVGLTITGGLYCGAPSVNSNQDVVKRSIPTPDGTIVRIPNAGSFITMYGGGLWFYGRASECQMPKTFDLYGGDLVFVGSLAKNIPSGASVANPAVLNLRGGRILASMRDDLCYGATVLPDTNAFRVVAFDKPTVIKGVDHFANTGENRTITLGRPIESGVTEGTDGGLVLEGAPVFVFKYPVLLNGPFNVMDGEVQLAAAADTAATPAFFGTGDFNLGNVKFRFTDSASASKTLRFATDESAKFRVKGAAQITFRTDSAKAAHHVEVGGYARERGGVLFLSEAFANGAFGSSFKVDGGLETNAAGMLKTPVLFYDSTGDGAYHFAGYSSGTGVVPFTDTVEGLDGGAESVAKLTRAATLNDGDVKSVAALMVTSAKLTLKEGSRLNVGLGDDPALVFFDRDYWSDTSPAGAGTIDFGSREGIVSMSGRPNNAGSLVLPYTFAGSGGMTFVSSSEKAYKWLALSGNNTYTGGTLINSIRVEPKTSSAFGTGDVTVGGGERAGGRVYLGSALTLANNFHLAGWGINQSIWGEDGGAMTFAADATISGSVELRGEVMVAALAKSHGTISGSVSGDRLLLPPGNGTLVLAGANTYTGGTEVVKATVAATRSDSLGVGLVILDSGTLAFENSAALTFTNDLVGVGTIALKGTAPVAFACDISKLDAPLDLCGTRQPFTALPPFATIKNSATKKATIALAENLGTVEWGDYALEGKISLDIGEGTVLDLGGRTLDVYRLEKGAVGKVVNGTVNEERPLAGLMLIVK